MTKFFKTSGSLTEEKQDGDLVNSKREFLIEAATFGDAENTATSYLSGMTNFKDTIILDKVEKTKIEDLLFNDSFVVDNELKCGLIEYSLDEGHNLYAASVEYQETLDNGKLKKTNDTVWCPAESPVEAIDLVERFLESAEQRDFTVKGVKCSKISSVMVSPMTHQKYMSQVA